MLPILDKIVAYKKEELQVRRRMVSLKDVELKAADAEPARDFFAFFKKAGINIIAEVKKASPSAGMIREDFKPEDIAQIYADNGAVAISVLTDEHFFSGHLDDLKRIKGVTSLPCLRKDFLLSEYHVFEARGAGADAILLMAVILDDYQLRDYRILAQELGMTSLIEIHDQKELERSLKSGASAVGVNNRNLKDFQVSLDTSLELVSHMPQSTRKISESGLHCHDDLVKLKEAGYDGFLIGEALMREKDMAKKLKELAEGRS